MKLFCARISLEANTFTPMPTALEDFRVFRGPPDPKSEAMSHLQLQAFKRLADERGWEMVYSLSADAGAGGKAPRKVYEDFRDEILAALKQAMPVNAVLLPLHGAMVAEGYDDCEGDLVVRIREIVGPDVPIGVELDPHCHMTPEKMQADVIVLYKEFPHTDQVARAEDLFRLIADQLEGKTKPLMSLFDCQMIGSYFTTIEPMKSLVDKVKGLEGKDKVLSISPVHGFPYADVPGNGTKMLVITDNDESKGAKLAEELGQEWIALRGKCHPTFLDTPEACAHAMKAPGKPIVMADVGDNPGGGFPGDNTRVLRQMLEAGVTDAAFAAMWDPIVVDMCTAAGVGAKLRVRLGGKIGEMSDEPLNLDVEVTAVNSNLMQHHSGSASSLGKAVALRCKGIDIVVASLRNQVRGIDAFSNMGIDPLNRKILALKSTNHFRAEFEKIGKEILYVARPDVFTYVPFSRIQRPKWPMDNDLHGLGGPKWA